MSDLGLFPVHSITNPFCTLTLAALRPRYPYKLHIHVRITPHVWTVDKLRHVSMVENVSLLIYFMIASGLMNVFLSAINRSVII